MAGSQISTSVTIINSLLGFQAISLTEFDTSAESSIAAGSKVEIASAFFTFAADEAISGFSAITTGETAYIALTPSGTAGSQIVSAAWTEDAPVWDDAKQGWYSTTSSSVRYIAMAHKSGTSSCEGELIFDGRQGGAPGDVRIGGSLYGLPSGLPFTRDAPFVSSNYIDDTNVTGATLWGYFAPLIPNTGETVMVSGSGGVDTGINDQKLDIIMGFQRYNASNILILGVEMDIDLSGSPSVLNRMIARNFVNNATVQFAQLSIWW